MENDEIITEQPKKSNDSLYTTWIPAIVVVTIMIIGIIIGIAATPKKPEWANNVSESQIVQVAKSKIKSQFNYPSTVSFSAIGGEVTYKEEDFNADYYISYYTNTCTAKNAFGVEQKYLCQVCVRFNKSNMNYSVLTPVISLYN